MRTKISILFLILILAIGEVCAQESEVIKIKSLSVNSRFFNDMSPVLTKDGIAFCSDRKQSAIWDVRDFNRTLMYNIYYAARGDSTDFAKPVPFSVDLGPLVHEGPFCFSPDGEQIYYTSNLVQGKKAQRKDISNNRGIFIADKDGDGWTNIRPFKHNDPLWNVAHPFISSDGKYLFFASDIPGGEGGSDIWWCEWVNNDWADPVNMGPGINSSSSDLYPYFSSTQELYFASNREGGVGGLDLYKTSLRFGQWKTAVILPEPVNSSDDDFSYFIDPGSSQGYFTSNRGRNDDIYTWTSNIKRMDDCTFQVEDEFCYEFSEKNAHRYDSLPFEFEWDFDDGTIAKGDVVVHCFEKAGMYVVKLSSINLLTGEIKKEEKVEFMNLENTKQAYMIAPDTCMVGEIINFDASNSNLPGWSITEYYWNFDDGTIATGISSPKVYSEDGTYIVQLIVTAEPDNDGNSRQTCVSKYVVVQERQ